MEITTQQIYVVTGGASGLGAGVVRLLGDQGATVVIADRDEERGRALAGQIKQHFVKCDITSEADASRVFEFAASRGALRGLVNCAGIAGPERVVGKERPHALESFERIVRVNLVGTFNMIRLGAQLMSHQEPTPSGERGVIVNTASVAAFDGQIGQAAYAASKAGIVGMTLPVARDLARSAIRCVTIAPGIFSTPLLMDLSLEVRQGLAASVPFPSRLGEPRDFALMVQHVLNNEMLNGEVIRLDGAIRMGPR
ncbi:SDR family NAD(P)-dependent oxidoreductase [Bordetella sp. BOR01]|uniref:SDR family NAD(P)-dependent oxidoreductase n=1 Tax=Bordetella sp. BOR01 TaxID=2854779 RepID=UPI001C46C3C0|nr:SDR family NAD(P)-dependent oxidoreductase [Bordetella sp. BOR01]MBV7481696.1 SDR family NAD(P)-dependent oxidoreductase [Bordetella sp. BOR01]